MFDSHIPGLAIIGLDLVGILFFLWMIFLGGAERLDGTFKSGFLFSSLALHWGSEGLKIAAWIGLIGCTYSIISQIF